MTFIARPHRRRSAAAQPGALPGGVAALVLLALFLLPAGGQAADVTRAGPFPIVYPAAAPAGVDTDGDGVKDSLDQCPGTPTGHAVDGRGCASAQLDEDADGFMNHVDACPGTGAGVNIVANGCSAEQLAPSTLAVTAGAAEPAVTPEPSPAQPPQQLEALIATIISSPPGAPPAYDADGDGFAARAFGGSDCDDSNPATYPGAAEIPYNLIDENCNGMADDDDFDQDGQPSSLDPDDTNPAVFAASGATLAEAIEAAAGADFSDAHAESAGVDCGQCHGRTEPSGSGCTASLAAAAPKAPLDCSGCHSGRHISSAVNRHLPRVACSTCHLPTAARNPEPADGLDASPPPRFRFWDGSSQASLSGQAASASATTGGRETGGKLYPFRFQAAELAVTRESRQAIEFDAGVYLATGDPEAAIRQGLKNMGLPADTPIDWITTVAWLPLTQQVGTADTALGCVDCHSSARIDFAALGYGLKAPEKELCADCHSLISSRGFLDTHDRHVTRRKIDCSACHTFSGS